MVVRAGQRSGSHQSGGRPLRATAISIV